MTQRHPRGLTRRIRALLCALVLSTATTTAVAAEPSDATVERLTTLVVEAVPLGEIFEMLADTDPAWPMQDKPDAVTPAQLACLRRELSADGYRASKRVEVANYAKRSPGTVEGDIRILSDGAAFLMRELMLAGAQQERTGKPMSEEDVLGKASPAQVAAFMTFMTDADYRGLRRLTGIGSAFSPDNSQEENEAAGESAGENMAMRAMLGAMERCDVSTSALF